MWQNVSLVKFFSTKIFLDKKFSSTNDFTRRTIFPDEYGSSFRNPENRDYFFVIHAFNFWERIHESESANDGENFKLDSNSLGKAIFIVVINDWLSKNKKVKIKKK